MERTDGIMNSTLQFMLMLMPVPIRTNAIRLQIGCAQFPINDVRLDHTPRFLPGTYSVNPAKRTTSKAPSPNPCARRKKYRTCTFGDSAAPIMTAIWIHSYRIMDFLRPILSPIGPPTNAPKSWPIVYVVPHIARSVDPGFSQCTSFSRMFCTAPPMPFDQHTSSAKAVTSHILTCHLEFGSRSSLAPIFALDFAISVYLACFIF